MLYNQPTFCCTPRGNPPPRPEPPLPLITTERLILRQLTEADAPFILDLMNDPDWHRYIGDRGVRTIAQATEYIRTGPMAMYAQHGFGLYLCALRSTSEPIGMCGLLKRDYLDEVDIGFALMPQYRGQGLAREAAAGVLQHATGPLGIRRIAAITSPANHRSIHLLEQLGLHFERLLLGPGATEEVCLYEGSLADWGDR